MKILFDHQAFSIQRFGGVSNCFVQLIANLPNEVKWQISIKESDNVHLRESGLVNVKSESLNLQNFRTPFSKDVNRRMYGILEKRIPSLFRTSSNINKSFSIEMIKKGDYDLLHPTLLDSYFLEYNKKPFVITIHDMIPEICGSKYKDQIVGKLQQINKCSHIIAVSECTKKDIVRLLGVNPDKITVVYHGYDKTPIDFTQKPIFNSPYILYVGARNASYKNFRYFVCQCKEFLVKHRDFIVVCTGHFFTENEQRMFQELGIKDRFKHIFCSTNELNNLYSNAFAFVYPSEYEGFGMPILEAFHAKCPVILNNKSCFPEIATNAALYFDSECKINTLCNQLETLYHCSSEERRRLIDRGMDRLSFFSWEKASMELADVYRRVLADE